jgi:DNA mismatch endonuclease (patch repair protein)
MTDIVDSRRRSAMMARVHGRDTAPELAVRRIAHRMGLRFRLHRKDLPGRPDLVFPKHRLAVFVHGCFWHRHEGCRYASTPKSRTAFWTAKFAANVVRDARQEAALKELGWRVLVIWQCEIRNEAAVERKLDASIDRVRAAPDQENVPSVEMVESRGSRPRLGGTSGLSLAPSGSKADLCTATASAPGHGKHTRLAVMS